MRDDYKLRGETVKLELTVEKAVAETLIEMEKFSKHTQSELVNTAVKRFIVVHSDFLPRPPKREASVR